MMWRRNKKETEARSKMKKGDKVVAGGLVGEIMDVDERFAKVKVAPGVTVQVVASMMSPLDTAVPAPAATPAKDDKKAAIEDGGIEVTSSRRNALIVIALAAAGAYAFHRGADNFWGVISCGLIVVWALFGMLPVMDSAWRFKVGFVAVAFLARASSPLADARERDGRQAHVPRVRQGSHSPSASRRASTSSGGLRLVYTVEVDEAIRDKRDHFADEMRQELATSSASTRATAASRATSSTKLEEKVHVSHARERRHPPHVQGPGGHGEARRALHEEVRRRARADAAARRRTRSPSRSARRSRSQIRERAVTQAKDTVIRRVDELGLREAASPRATRTSSSRSPARTRSAFDEIKESSARPRASSSRWSTTTAATSSGTIRRARPRTCPRRGHRDLPARTRPSGPGKTAQDATSRASCKRQTERDDERRARALQGVDRDAQRPRRPRDRLRADRRARSTDTGSSSRRSAGARSTSSARAEVTGDFITDAQRRARTSSSGVGELLRRASRSPPPAPTASRRSPARTSSAASRSSSTTSIDSRAGHQDEDRRRPRQHHAGRGRSASSSSQNARSSSSCSGPARSRRRSRRRTSSSSARRSGRTRSRRACKGALVGVGLVLVFMVVYYRKSRRRRRHRGALQPAPPARDPRDRSAPR